MLIVFFFLFLFLTETLQCPYLLPNKASSLVKCLLQHQPWQGTFQFTLEGFREEDKDLEKTVTAHMALLDNKLQQYLPKCQFGVAERCLIAAK
jgi:hypothetical protein